MYFQFFCLRSIFTSHIVSSIVSSLRFHPPKHFSYLQPLTSYHFIYMVAKIIIKVKKVGGQMRFLGGQNENRLILINFQAVFHLFLST